MYQPQLTQFLARLALGVAGMLAALAAYAETFVLPPPDVDIVGGVQVAYSKQEDTIMDIARRYDVGYDQIIKVNPGVDRWMPGEGTPIVLPTRYILPNAPRDGLVLNVSEMRIYYYPKPEPGQKTGGDHLSGQHRAHGLENPAGQDLGDQQGEGSALVSTGFHQD